MPGSHRCSRRYGAYGWCRVRAVLRVSVGRRTDSAAHALVLSPPRGRGQGALRILTRPGDSREARERKESLVGRVGGRTNAPRVVNVPARAERGSGGVDQPPLLLGAVL